MNIFKRLFKKNTYKDFKLNDTIYNSKKICTIGELFKALYIDEEIEQMKRIENTDTYYIDNIRINKKTYEKLDSIILNNLLSKKNKYARLYSERHLKSQHSFDNLIYAPYIDESIPDNIIRVLKINHPKYKKLKDYNK